MRDEFLITRQGKQFVLFAGLLDQAHTEGLKSIDTHLLQVPGPDNGNVAIVKAVCQMEDGRKFSGIGDASPENVGRNIAPHIIRMAETRSKARALRDAINIGATALEELVETDGPESGTSRGQSSSRPTPIRSAQRSSGQRSAASGNTQQPGQENADKREPKARKSQVDLLKTLAVEWAGEGGVERLEKRIEKPLKDLSRAEADTWIEKLTPEEGAEGSGTG